MSSDLLKPLDDRQRAVAEATRGPVAVLAVAGAGKTRAMAHRIAYAVASGDQNADQGLALTYTTKAAYELRNRLASLGVGSMNTATIHAVALRQLNYFWPKVVGGVAPTVLARREGVLERLLESIAPDLTGMDYRKVRAEFEWAKASGLDLAGYGATDRELPPELGQLLAALWQQYEEANLRAGRIDFDDVIQLLTGLLDTRPDVAEEVRRRYRWFTVDEYQDITPLQDALLRQWLGDSEELCVVGDVSQSIYGFAGADASLLTGFASRYPRAAVLELDTTYRCASAVADFAAAMLPVGQLRPRAVRSGGAVSQLAFSNSAAEVASVTEQIVQLADAGVDLREIAILVRVGAQMPKFERALAAAGVPFSSRGAQALDHPVARRMQLALRAAGLNPVGESLLAAVRGSLNAAGWIESDVESEQWAIGSGLMALAEDLAAAGADLSEFLQELDQRQQALTPPRPRAVTLSTMHSAKGLEWEHVFLPELVDRLLPYPGVDESEERNLLYVATTRAKEGLHLSWSTADDRGRACEPSRFLQETGTTSFRAPASRAAVNDQVAAVETRAAAVIEFCATCGGGLGSARERILGICRNCPNTFDAGLFERLSSWRTVKANELGLPELLLVSDARLTQLAAQRPRDRVELEQLCGEHSRAVAFADEILQLLT